MPKMKVYQIGGGGFGVLMILYRIEEQGYLKDEGLS